MARAEHHQSKLVSNLKPRLSKKNSLLEPAPTVRITLNTLNVKEISAPCRVVYPTPAEAVGAAKEAFPKWSAMPIEKRKEVIAQIRSGLQKHAGSLSKLALEETGLGRYEDKIRKHYLAIQKTPGPEYLGTAVFSGDDGLTLTEHAPYGVIAAVTPKTNPSTTIINNAISMLSAGNTVVFNPTSLAAKTAEYTLQLMMNVIFAMGGPAGCLTMVKNPCTEVAHALMMDPNVALLVVTGGAALVKAAMSSGKKTVSAGPGNPPVVVDETANPIQAAKGIYEGASFENNILCISEKEIIVVDKVADEFQQAFEKIGAYRLNEDQVKRMTESVVDWKRNGKYPKKEFVGKNATVLLRSIGITASERVRLLFCEVDEKHPFVQNEMLMPLIPVVRVDSVDEAVKMAKRVEHGFRHTATMYSKNIDHLNMMAKEINTSIFVSNAPCYAGVGLGGQGYTSFTIASPTGDGPTTCRNFSRNRRCVLSGHFRIV